MRKTKIVNANIKKGRKLSREDIIAIIDQTIKNEEIVDINKQVVTDEIDKQIVTPTNLSKRFILCLILKEGKGSSWVWVNDSFERFSFNDNTYFKQDEGTYQKDNLRFLIFLEGISMPMHHGYIERETIKKLFTDKNTGKEKSIDITKIKGLKYDSKAIDMLLNRHLADEFTKQHMDLPNLAIIVLLILNLIISGIGAYGGFA